MRPLTQIRNNIQIKGLKNEMRNILDGTKNRKEEAEEEINGLKDSVMENNLHPSLSICKCL